MPIIGATELQPVNILGSYAQGLELGRANQLARQQAATAQQQAAQNQLLEEAKLREQRGKAMQEETKGIEGRMQYWRRLIPADPRLAPAWVSAAYSDPVVGPELSRLGSAEEVIASIPKDPSQYMQWAEGASMFADEYAKRRTLTAEQEAQEAERVAQRGFKEREIGLRGRELGVQQANVGLRREELGLQREKTQREIDQERKVVARTETDEAGNVTSYNKFGDVIKTQAGAGKPSAQFIQTREKKKETTRQLTEVIASLTDAMKPGGLIEQSTGSGAGRLADVAAGFVGYGTPGATAAAKLAPIADQVLKLVPRFEGPQSDKDTQSYKEAAGMLADATQPNNVRMAAAQTILEIYKRRRDQFLTSDTPGTSVDIDALLDKYQ